MVDWNWTPISKVFLYLLVLLSSLVSWQFYVERNRFTLRRKHKWMYSRFRRPEFLLSSPCKTPRGLFGQVANLWLLYLFNLRVYCWFMRLPLSAKGLVLGRPFTQESCYKTCALLGLFIRMIYYLVLYIGKKQILKSSQTDNLEKTCINISNIFKVLFF